MNILTAIKDPNLFRSYFGQELKSWERWFIALRALYGLGITKPESKALVRACTARSASKLPVSGFRTAAFLCGRRSGKSRIAAVIATYESLFAGHEKRLARGETGMVALVAPTRLQASICWKYIRGIFLAPLLEKETANIREGSFEQTLTLRNGIEIRVLSGDFRSVRGFSLVAAVVDEAAYLGTSDESRVRSDDELIRALKPSLLTSKGRLIVVSSKYMQRGWCYRAWRRFHGANRTEPGFSSKWSTLIWDADSKTMNPDLDQDEIAAAYEEDPASARSEFGNCWREDLEAYASRDLIEALVVQGRLELSPRPGIDYGAGVDLSGGKSDAAALCVLHREGGKIIQDFIRIWPAPHNPYSVVAEMSAQLSRFRLTKVTGDAYGGEWPVKTFQAYGVRYQLADRPKSKLFLELLPELCGGRVELLDHAVQTHELVSLERRPKSGGSDTVDHPRNQHDDLANALAVAVSVLGRSRGRIGTLWPVSSFQLEPQNAYDLARF